jgi:ankyrin repeat domain-containing protein 50
VLAKSLIDSELQSTDTHSICYLFFKDNSEQNRIATALCALLHQLFGRRPPLLQHAMLIWGRNGEKVRDEVDELWRILLVAATDPVADGVTCVLDALDECREDDRRKLIRFLTDFYTRSCQESPRKGQLKFLVTSRPYGDIELDFDRIPSNLPAIRLSGEDQNEGIRDEINLVIKERVSTVSRELRLNRMLKDLLEEKLLAISHRTYLWLHLVIEEIRRSTKRTERQYIRIINSVPETVEEAYEKILSRNDPKERGKAEKLLYIIIGARRPLTLAEMDVAFQIATESENAKAYGELDLDRDHLKTRIRDLCGLFIFVNDSRVYLIHQTAKEFLVRKDLTHSSKNGCWKHALDERSSAVILAKVCIQYLNFADFENGGSHIGRVEQIQKSDSRCFLNYSARHWPEHFRDIQAGEEKHLGKEVFRLYDTRSKRFKIWYSIFWREMRLYEDKPKMSNLSLAAFNGHDAVVKQLLEVGKVHPDSKDGSGRTPLCWAARNGHKTTVKLLLETGKVHPDSKDGSGRTPLFWAAGNGHKRVMKLLLETGKVDPGSKDGSGRTLLWWAAGNGQDAVVKLLFETKIHPDSKDRCGRTPLCWAAEFGHEAVVKRLLETGKVDPDSKDGFDETPLHRAAWYGCEAIVKLLLETGKVDPDSKDRPGRTPLHRAAETGREAVVNLLLETGKVDPDPKDEDGWTPLWRAAENGHEAVVKQLLETRKMDPDSKDVSGRTPLWRAAENGHEAVVKLLLQTGKVDPDSKDRSGWTPLRRAAVNGHEAVVKLLQRST